MADITDAQTFAERAGWRILSDDERKQNEFYEEGGTWFEAPATVGTKARFTPLVGDAAWRHLAQKEELI